MSALEELPEGNTTEAVEFLRKMLPDHRRHLVAIDSIGRVVAKTFEVGKEGAMADWIDARQGLANVYVHVNELKPDVVDRKAKKEDVARAHFVHVDIDDEQAFDRLRGFEPAPTAVVHSGGGCHTYWQLRQPSKDLERVEAVNIALAKALGGDNCHNIDRIMRVPGTVNLPNAKKRKAGRKPTVARLVEADWSRSYSLDDFPQGSDPSPSAPGAVVAQEPDVVPLSIEELPSAVLPVTRTLIEEGDDPDRPRGRKGAHFKSRSETVFRVACDLAKLGCEPSAIAGVLINPTYRISASILEKTDPIAYALRQAKNACKALSGGWPDCDRAGRPRATMRNTLVALQRLGLSFGYDRFRQRKHVQGHLLQEFQGELSDDAVVALRGLINERFDFDPRAENVRDAVLQLCLENPHHPVCEMLDQLEWDGVPRLDTVLIDYFGADDTPLNRAVGPITFIAAVRRVRQPGVKFDQVLVLEGPQGSGKSTALQILAGEGLHADGEILTQKTQVQMEAMEGVWIYELGEVEGFGRAEVNKIKAFVSRQVDRSRMAYGRFAEERPRQCVFIGTTNEKKYFRDQTGNRRFWPVKTGQIDLEALRRDRDQLLAEADHRERQGESIILSPDLWEAAAEQQAARLEEDPWLAILAKVEGKVVGDIVRISTEDLLSNTLGIPVERQNQAHSKRLASHMLCLGWAPAKWREGKHYFRGYQRPVIEAQDDGVDF